MNNQEFTKVVDEQLTRCCDLLLVKGNEYDSNTGDRLHSFKVAAELQHTTPKLALAGMMAKHTVSVYDMCVENSSNLDKWDEKITDSINYLLLLKGLVMDESGTYGGELITNTEEGILI